MPYAPLVPPAPWLTGDERARYARHLTLGDIGEMGQRRLKNARVLVVGAGGLGSAAILYLAAAGVGTIGVVDDDLVTLSNLQRQVIHATASLGRHKTDSAADAVAALNPLVTLVPHRERLTPATVLTVLADYDVVVDGSDSFATRYLVSDACVRLGLPDVWGSVLAFDGQASVWWPGIGPCLRCVFPAPPPAGAVASCEAAGVLGSVCAAVAAVQATETVKLLLGIGEPLVGRVLVVDALGQRTGEVTAARNPDCPVCRPGAPLLGPLTEERGVAGACTDRGGAPAVTPADVVAAGDAGGLLVDVREARERAVASIPGSVHVPMSALRAGWRPETGRKVVVYCATGIRSAEAARILAAEGHAVADLAGGLAAWADAGLAVGSGD